MEKQLENERIAYLDYLRVFACFLVVLLHVSAQNIYAVAVGSGNWWTFHIYDSISRCAVPLFVMISGALFLGREVNIRRLYSKNILRLVVSFFFWSLVYALFMQGVFDAKMINFLGGHYHLGFIPALVGVYILIPVLHQIAQNASVMRYYLLVCGVFAVVLPWIGNVAELFLSGMPLQYFEAFTHTIDNMGLKTVVGYSFFFVLGYYLSRVELGRRARLLIYLLGIVGLAGTIGLTYVISVSNGQMDLTFYSEYSLNVFVYMLAVFVLFRYMPAHSMRMDAGISYMAKHTFGIYLVHALILEQLLDKFGIGSLRYQPIWWALLYTVVVMLLSFVTTWMIRRIPVVRDYIV